MCVCVYAKMIEVDIERIYEEMLVYYRQLEKEQLHSIPVVAAKRHSTSVVGRPLNYSDTARTPRLRRTMSGSITQFASMYEK